MKFRFLVSMGGAFLRRNVDGATALEDHQGLAAFRRRSKTPWHPIVLLIGCLLFGSGCGVKDLPRLPSPEPATLTNLTADREGDRVVLRWSMGREGAAPPAFRIYRSGQPPCEGCPRPFQRIAEVVASDVADNGGFRFSDSPPGPDQYEYQVVPVAPGGAEAGAGARVEIQWDAANPPSDSNSS